MTTLGDMIYGDTSGTVTRLPLAAAGTQNMLLAETNGSAPHWLPLLNVTGALAVGLAGYAWSQLNPGSAGQVLTMASGTPAWVTPASQAAVLSVYLSADQAITASAYNAIVYNTVYLNTHAGGSFSAATGVFTCPVAGMYRIMAQVACASGNINAQIVHNGNTVAFGPGASLNLAWNQYMAMVTVERSCAAGDTIYANVYGNAANTVKGNQYASYMTIDLIK